VQSCQAHLLNLTHFLVNKMKISKKSPLNIAKQAIGIRNRYSQFEVTFSHKGLTAIGYIQPTSRSIKYKVKIKYTLNKQPEITVLEPKLVKNSSSKKIPHTYTRNRLCLFRPKYGEFQYWNYISKTIIPWTSLWLYHYEVWHMTGNWQGGGEHPKLK
jgi:hypothetical protein